MSATPSDTSVPGALTWYYAGFWWRVLAFVIDATVLAVADWLIGLATGLRQVGFSTSIPSDSGPVSNVAYSSLSLAVPSLHLVGGGLILLAALRLAYYALLESSHWQATIGKLACRLRVTGEAGRRIGLGRAIGRNLPWFVSAFLLGIGSLAWYVFLPLVGIGFLMVGWTRRKQGLHDLVAGTLVLRRRPADLMFGFQPPVA